MPALKCVYKFIEVIMDNFEKNKICDNCKFFNRHYIISDNKRCLLRTKLGTCTLEKFSNAHFPEANQRACQLFRPAIENVCDEEIISELRSVACNLDNIMFIIKEERRKRKENDQSKRYF